MDYAAFLVPVVILEFVLLVIALIHVLRHKKYRVGNRILWVIVVCFIQIIGPVAYFIFGRGEEE